MSKFNSKVIELSEDKSGNYFEITGRLCYLDDFNMNGIKLNSTDKLQSNIDTLVNMPVVAYYNWDWDGNENLGGHEAYEGMDGKLKFGTSAVGTHTEVWVQNEMVKPVYSESEIELPCIYAKARIWSRFENFSRVIKKLFYEGELYSSWEIEPKFLNKEDSDIQAMPNPRSCDEWEFISNCLLGMGITPAFGNVSKITELSSEQKSIQKELSDALKLDLELSLKKEKWGTGKKYSIDKSKESASNSDWGSVNKTDLLNKILEAENNDALVNACYMEVPQNWKDSPSSLLKYPVMAFENDTLVYYIKGCQSALSFMNRSDTDESDEAKRKLMSIYKKLGLLKENPNERSANMEKMIEELKVTLSEKDEAIQKLEAIVSELSSKVSDIEKSELDKKNLEKSELEEKLIKATETIEALNTQVSELEPFKAQVEVIELEKAEVEKVAKVEQLKTLATDGGFIKVEEFETSEELKLMLENLDENAIKLAKAERVLATINVEKPAKKVEASAKQELSEKEVNSKDFMSEFLGL